jgi:chromosome segregation ATPase
MKNNTILAFVIAGAMSLSSCTKKVDEKTVAEINQFGTEWTALGEKATNWSNELTATTTQAKEFAAKQTEMATTMATSKDATMKSRTEEMAKAANDDATKLETMQNEWSTFKATWDETTAQYNEWKDKVLKGEVTSEEAVNGLAEFRTKMSDASAKVDSWSTTYAEVKTSCEKNMAMATETPANPTPETKK